MKHTPYDDPAAGGEAPAPKSSRPGRWTDHERATVVRSLLDGETAEQCARQLTGRSVEAVRRLASKLQADGAKQDPPVELPSFPRKSAGPDWEALRKIVAEKTAKDRRAEV